MGKAGEKYVKPIIDKFFQTDMIEQPRFAPFDFICKNCVIWLELKTRKCRITTYRTLWVNYDKVIQAREARKSNPNRKYYFAFNLYDGIFYVEYKEDLFDGFNDGWFQRQDRDVLQPEQHILNIPTQYLTKLAL